MKNFFLLICYTMFVFSLHAQHFAKENASISLTNDPPEVRQVQTMDDFISFFLGAGPSFILGGSSWNDPVGGETGFGVNFYHLKNNLSLRAEIKGTLQGASYKDTDPQPITGVVKLIYIHLPIYARYMTKKKFYGELGIQPGFLVSAKEKYKTGGEETTVDIKDQIKKFEFGIPVGVGYRISKKFSAGIRAVFGLSGIYDEDGGTTDRNLLITARASYTIF